MLLTDKRKKKPRFSNFHSERSELYNKTAEEESEDYKEQTFPYSLIKNHQRLALRVSEGQLNGTNKSSK